MSPVSIDLPTGTRTFTRLVLDFTGTLSLDGTLLAGVADRLRSLADQLELVVLTADTFGTAAAELEGLPLEVCLIRNGKEKARLVSAMEPAEVIAVGNGTNDVPMVELAGLGIAVLGPEGASAPLLSAADVVTGSIQDALDLIRNPLRLKATLRR
jgi:P-type E1-E2 ATPase